MHAHKFLHRISGISRAHLKNITTINLMVVKLQIIGSLQQHEKLRRVKKNTLCTLVHKMSVLRLSCLKRKMMSGHLSSRFPWFRVWPFSQNHLCFLQALRLPRGPPSLALGGAFPFPTTRALSRQGRLASETREVWLLPGPHWAWWGWDRVPKACGSSLSGSAYPGVAAVPFV